MPLPRRLGRINRYLANPIMRTFAGRLPPLAIVHHRGRRSGREFRAPVWAFPVEDGFVVALTYGAGADWVQNVLAAGGCTLERRGRRLRLGDPVVVTGDAGLGLLPAVLRPVLRVLDVDEVLRLRTPAAGPAPLAARRI